LEELPFLAMWKCDGTETRFLAVAFLKMISEFDWDVPLHLKTILNNHEGTCLAKLQKG